ncbi:PLP-dependent transferase [Auricularia subglabra TFB-10046 SS5]|uniref:PLP-dependent transferase n=1 Tax=Auricularia subglabra (strain TFB-10046 / SS5) TaxID=717982 RepID=J0DA04_AURST|nr:PLP-dependent transferase [Auricularia subglabra TFB-10046 SS5]
MAYANEKLADAVDLTHHLSELSKRRKTSPLKGMQKYMTKPGTLMLAGGLPDPSYFPFASIGGEAMAPDSYALTTDKPSSSGPLSWLWNIFGASKDKTTPIVIPRFPTGPNELSLADSLQYGPATGVALLQQFIHDFAERVYQPGYKNWTTLIHVGNTDGWSRCVQTLCNPGEVILTEEWTYPSAVALAAPYEVTPVPVGMDAEGMSASSLEDVLANWDEAARGAKRPHVMYTVPVGQNPCGMTMGLQRKKEIYEICVKYDVVIVEDDPYYFLQEGAYVPKAERKSATVQDTQDGFIKSLVPSYLKVDYQGRVVRLDTFSKTIAPGSRLGFFTCNPVFAERFERQGETTTQRPCGFGQALIGQLLTKQWGLDNYVRWLHGLQAQYTARRDALVDGILEGFDSSLSYSDGSYFAAGLPVYSCFLQRGARKKQLGRVLSFVAPTSGMFVWVTVHFDGLPDVPPQDDPEAPRDHETRLWVRFAEAGLLVAPGAFFASTPAIPRADRGHYRIAFSMGPHETLKKGMGIFTKQLQAYFDDALARGA